MGYNKISLYGGQTCDYLYISAAPVSEENFRNIDSEPTSWTSDTLALSTFDNESLSAGNSVLTENIDGYEIRRQAGASSNTEYIGTIPKDLGQKFIVDYAAKNNSEYTYYLYPSSKSNSESPDAITLNPFKTSEVHTNWGYWTLMVVDETDEEGIFYLNKMFKFEFNLSEGGLSNNASTTVTENFTRYPTVQHGMSNYWSGTLSSLCGIVTCNPIEYLQTTQMIDEFKELSSDTRRKFLKDIQGNLWEVEITSPIGISTDSTALQRPQSISYTWTEVGDASGISIINNPSKRNTSWILTETGQAVPYIEYIWGEDYIWNNSYRWTARDDRLQPQTTNMGRELFDKGGDE